MLLNVGSWNCIVCSNGGGPTYVAGSTSAKSTASLQVRKPGQDSSCGPRRPQPLTSASLYRTGLKAGSGLPFSIQAPGIADRGRSRILAQNPLPSPSSHEGPLLYLLLC